MADALTILIIRHAEKPGEDWPGEGSREDGTQDSQSLVIRGWQRAGAWAGLFGLGLGGRDYLKPDVVYAADPGDGPPNHGPSRRPYETAEPLGIRLGFELAVKKDFAKGEEDKLVDRVVGLSGVVLISWEHKAIISDILPRIPTTSGSVPTDWPGHRYDVVLRFDRAGGEDKFAFRALYPKLLSGDSDKPLPGSS